MPLSGIASAHVTVSSPEAQQGGYAKLVFRAPTEKDVPTTKITVVFPEDHPIASVRVKPQQGWKYQLSKGAPAVPLEVHGSPVKEVVKRITWTATNDGIGPDEFEEFEASAGPLPETETLTFKALQTYADGEVVRWIEEQAPGAERPEHPAPVLELAPSEDHGGNEDAAAPEGTDGPEEEATPATPRPEEEATEAASATAEDGGTSTVLTAVTLALAALALIAAIAAFIRAGRERVTGS
jgi:uncharacterized protein YcnI